MFQRFPLGPKPSIWPLLLGLSSLFALLDPTPAHADYREDGASASTMGHGDTGYASTWGTAAIFYNPAGIIRLPLLSLEASYAYLDAINGHNISTSMVDAATNPYASIGVSYTYFNTDVEDLERNGHQMRVALATAYRKEGFSLMAGLGLRYMNLELGKDSRDVWTGDIGILLDFDERIRFGVVGKNLIESKTEWAPRKLGFGFSFVFASLEASASMDLDFGAEKRGLSIVDTWGFGLDWSIFDQVQLRAGFLRFEQIEQERLSFGLGWSNPSFAIDVGYSTALSEPTDMMVGTSIRWLPQ